MSMEDNANLNRSAINGVLWKFGERIIAQGVSFVISLILARLLMPEQYGTVSLLLVFISLANVFVSDGLGAALIQRKEATDRDFSTMFWCSCFFGALLYAVLFFTAPLIGAFYGNDELVPVIRVLAVQVPLAAVKTIQHSFVARNLLFRKFFWSTLGGTLVSGVIGIMMAYGGLGVWALVEQYLVNSAIDMTVLFFTVRWRPHFQFDMKSAREMLGFSWKLLLASFIKTFYDEVRALIIGKVYSEEDLAYNSKGGQFPSLVIANILTSISTVLFPVMSKVGDRVDDLKEMTRRSLKITSYLIFPMMAGMFAVAEPLVRLLLTEKWLGAVPFLQISCVYWIFQPCLTANDEAIKAFGRSDITLKLEIVKKIIGFVLVAGTMFISVYALAVSNVVFAFFSSIANIYPCRKYLHYGYREQFFDLLPILLLSLGMGTVVWLLSLLPIPDLPLLVLQVIVGAGLYVGGSILFRIDCFRTLVDGAKKMLHRKKEEAK